MIDIKILQINTFGVKSTGRIAVDIYKTLIGMGHDGVIAFARGDIEEGVPHIKIGNDLDVKFHGIMTRITDKTGFYSKKATKKLIEEIKKYAPDIIHLHNLHGYYINVEKLFNFFKTYKKPVVWTLHDCWSFTGHCAHFDFLGCEKWKTGCYNCPQKNTYPASLFLDNSKQNWIRKKELFTGLDMTIVVPSNWLANLVKQSFLKEHEILTIYNGINLDVFKPTDSDFRTKYNLQDKFIILGVASDWSEKKGLKDFIKLSQMIDSDKKIVLVGLNKKQLQDLPSSIIGIERTNSVKELAEIYSTVDVFFNPSVEETFGLTTIEAIACGTPSVVYKATASPEIVSLINGKSTEECGFVIDPGNLDNLLNILNTNLLSGSICNGNINVFNKKIIFNQYIDLYKKMLG